MSNVEIYHRPIQFILPSWIKAINWIFQENYYLKKKQLRAHMSMMVEFKRYHIKKFKFLYSVLYNELVIIYKM